MAINIKEIDLKMRLLMALLAIVFMNVSCANENDSKTQESGLQDKSSTVEENEILIPLSRTIEISIGLETRNIPVLWESERDLLDGSVKDVAIQDDQIYIFGSQFDIDKAPKAYEQYKLGNGESIHYYLENPIYFKAEDAYIDSFTLYGEEEFLRILDFSIEESFREIFFMGGRLAFELISGPKLKDSKIYKSIGSINFDDVDFLIKDSEEFGFLTLIDDILLDYHFDSKTRDRHTNIFMIKNKTMDLLTTLDAPSTQAGYRIGNTIYGFNVFYSKINYDLDNYSVSNFKLTFENSVFRQSEILDFNHVTNRNYASGYIGYNDDFDGFFWSFYEHGSDPVYYYILDDSIELTNQYVTEKGVFFTGQEDGKMLLIFLTLDGEIQWKANFRDGFVRGIAEHDGRYFIAGDYHIKRTDKERDWGTDYLYLAEIKID